MDFWAKIRGAIEVTGRVSETTQNDVLQMAPAQRQINNNDLREQYDKIMLIPPLHPNVLLLLRAGQHLKEAIDAIAETDPKRSEELMEEYQAMIAVERPLCVHREPQEVCEVLNAFIDKHKIDIRKK